MKIDPIIAVRDVNASAIWYSSIFGLKRTHDGDEFAILQNKNGEVALCLHLWETDHDHPTMKEVSSTPGNGLILYFRTENLEESRANLKEQNYPVEKEIHLSPNSRKMEFAVRDLDGYYLMVSEFHAYQG